MNPEPAIPAVTKLLRVPEASFEAARALTQIGPKGFAVLTNALSDPDASVRGAAIWVIAGEAPADVDTAL